MLHLSAVNAVVKLVYNTVSSDGHIRQFMSLEEKITGENLKLWKLINLSFLLNIFHEIPFQIPENTRGKLL